MAFRSGLRPVELGRHLERALEDGRTVGVDGRTVLPNDVVLTVSQADFDNLTSLLPALETELLGAMSELARSEGDRFMGPLRVAVRPDPARRPGTVVATATFKAAEAGVGHLRLADGRRIDLGSEVVRIGRLPDCAIQLNDPNVSRHHAEVRRQGAGFVVADNGSTNGTKLNGQRINAPRPLADGDELTIGASRLVFHTF